MLRPEDNIKEIYWVNLPEVCFDMEQDGSCSKQNPKLDMFPHEIFASQTYKINELQVVIFLLFL